MKAIKLIIGTCILVVVLSHPAMGVRGVKNIDLEGAKGLLTRLFSKDGVPGKVRFKSTQREDAFAKMEAFKTTKMDKGKRCTLLKKVLFSGFFGKGGLEARAGAAAIRHDFTRLKKIEQCQYVGQMMAYADFLAFLFVELAEAQCNMTKHGQKEVGWPKIQNSHVSDIRQDAVRYSELFKQNCASRKAGMRKKATGRYQSTFRGINNLVGEILPVR